MWDGFRTQPCLQFMYPSPSPSNYATVTLPGDGAGPPSANLAVFPSSSYEDSAPSSLKDVEPFSYPALPPTSNRYRYLAAVPSRHPAVCVPSSYPVVSIPVPSSYQAIYTSNFPVAPSSNFARQIKCLNFTTVPPPNFMTAQLPTRTHIPPHDFSNDDSDDGRTIGTYPKVAFYSTDAKVCKAACSINGSTAYMDSYVEQSISAVENGPTKAGTAKTTENWSQVATPVENEASRYRYGGSAHTNRRWSHGKRSFPYPTKRMGKEPNQTRKVFKFNLLFVKILVCSSVRSWKIFMC